MNYANQLYAKAISPVPFMMKALLCPAPDRNGIQRDGGGRTGYGVKDHRTRYDHIYIIDYHQADQLQPDKFQLDTGAAEAVPSRLELPAHAMRPITPFQGHDVMVVTGCSRTVQPGCGNRI